MKYRGARVIAIDDQKPHLAGIVEALQRKGVGVLPFHYTGETSLRQCAAGVRIVFSDISVLGSGGQPHQQHAAVAAILDTVLDPANGPWMMVAWTSSPNQVDDLHKVLVDALGPNRAPMASLALAKSEFMTASGKFRIGAIAEAIENRVTTDPIVGAIFDLELRAAEAARDITGAIVTMGSTGGNPTIADVLMALSKASDASSSASPELVFQTISPALQDRMVRRGITRSERNVWEAAFALSINHVLGPANSATMNTCIHLDPIARAGDRGAICRIPNDMLDTLVRATGMGLREMLFQHFAKKDKCLKEARRLFKTANPTAPYPSDEELTRSFEQLVSWWLIEAVPSCDVSNNKRGLRRALVGIGMPAGMTESREAGEFVKRLPTLSIGDDLVDVYVSAKVNLMPNKGPLARLKPLGRLRDSLLDGILHHAATSQSRLGWVSF